MPSKYEAASEETVPAARSIIAKALAEKYNLNETQVAAYLDVTQAAISNYLHEKSDNIKSRIAKMEKKVEESRKLVDSYIKNIADGKKEYASVCICTLCEKTNKFKCAFSHAVSIDTAPV